MAHHVRRAAILIARPLRAAPTPVPRVASRSGALTAQQIARLDTQFAQTIAATHVDLATIQKRTQEQPAATIHRPLPFTGVQATLTHGEGYIEPITPGERVGSVVCYHAHYTYMWPDGHLEDDDIPWPFRYPIASDLFAEHGRLIPLQLAPPGYHLTRALKPFLAHFVGVGVRADVPSSKFASRLRHFIHRASI